MTMEEIGWVSKAKKDANQSPLIRVLMSNCMNTNVYNDSKLILSSFKLHILTSTDAYESSIAHNSIVYVIVSSVGQDTPSWQSAITECLSA